MDRLLALYQAHKPATWKIVAVAAVPTAIYLLNRGTPDDYRTDIDAFFKSPEEVGSTGNTNKHSSSGKKELTSGSIDKFFKDADEDTRNPLDFDSFLKSEKGPSSGKQASAPSSAHAAAQSEQARAQPHHVRVPVLFGTEYGFSKEVAERLAAQLKAGDKYWPVLIDMAEHPEGYDFSKEQVVFMACSTQGDGVPPNEAREFCEWLFAGKAGSLSHLHYSVCAMGDRSYEHFCRCGKQLDAAMAAAGAKELAPRADIHREDYPAIDAWVSLALGGLAKLSLKTLAETGGVDAGADTGAKAQIKRWGKSRPFFASVVAQEGLCTLASKDDKNTIRTEFDLADSGITYLPGDALGIYPTNAAAAVEELLQQLGAKAGELVAVPSWHYAEEGTTYADNKMQLRDALTKCYDLRSPKTDIFKLLASLIPAAAAANGHANGHHANGNGHAAAPTSSPAEQVAKLAELIAADAAQQDAYFSKRHVIDVLQEFPAARPTTAQLLGVLRQLQPRLYSISSSPLENAARVQVTVAEVKYECLGKDRIGVCSTYLSERLQVGARVPIYVHKNPDFRLPADPATPILMVGPGTGLAPFRSFILERLLAKKQAGAACGDMVLYFGCRRRDQDYLYGPVLEGWGAAGDITLFTAFSREQAKKVYVQDRLRESGDMVWRLLQAGGHFYVCGDASSMAGSVETQLLAIIEAHQAQGPDAAKAYLQQLSDTGRYQRDVWY